MDLSGIVLAVLIVLVGLGTAAGVMVVLPTSDRERSELHPESEWPERGSGSPELPPPGNAWKPETWYSEIADGTQFPNQPSPSFRVSADSSFQKAIARRDWEGQVSDEPTRPHASVSSLAGPTPVPPSARSLESPLPDDVEALTQIPTVAMRSVPVKDNLPPTLKQRAVRRGRSTDPSPENRPNPAPVFAPPPDHGDQMPPPEISGASIDRVDVEHTAELVDRKSGNRPNSAETD